MKNVYEVGKIDYLNNGRKENLVTIEWELKDGSFSMSGNVWNRLKTDIYSGGQNLEEILKAFPFDKKVKRMVEIWRIYHLNNLQAGCEHQRSLGWGNKKINGPKGYPEWEGHLYEKEGGCLMKKCPTCQYPYGSKWLKLEIPNEIIKEIESWSNLELAK